MARFLEFQDRNRPKDNRPRFAPRPCRRMTVLKNHRTSKICNHERPRSRRKGRKGKTENRCRHRPDGRKRFRCIRQRPAACDARKTCRKKKKWPSGVPSKRKPSTSAIRCGRRNKNRSCASALKKTDRHPKRISGIDAAGLQMPSRSHRPTMPDNADMQPIRA